MHNIDAQNALLAAFCSGRQKAILCDRSGKILAVSDELIRHSVNIVQDVVGRQLIIHSARFNENKPWYKSLPSHHRETRLSGAAHIDTVGELHQLNILTIQPLETGTTLVGFKVTLEDESLFEQSLPNSAWQQLFSESSAGMCLFDDTFAIVSANSAFKTLIGSNLEPHQKIFDLLSVQNDFKKWFLNTDNFSAEALLRSPDRQIRTLINITPIDLGGRQVFWCIFNDTTVITEQAVALTQSFERLDNLINDNLNGIAFVSADDRFIEVNNRFAAMLQLDKKDMIGKHFSHFNAANSYELSPKDAETFVKTGFSRPFVKRLVRKDGQEIDVTVHLFPNFDSNGEFTGAWNFIHQSNDKQQEVIHASHYFESLFNDSQDAMVLTSLNGKVKLANNAFAAFLGQTAPQLIGQSIIDLTVPEDRRIEKNLHTPLLLERGYSDQYEKRFVSATGEEVPVSVRSVLVSSTRGKPEAVWTIARDANIQRKLIQSLAISERRFRSLFSNSFDAIGFWTVTHEMQYANKAYLDLVGYSQEELRNLTFQDFTPPGWEEADEKMSQQVDERGYSDIFEKEVLRKDGQRVPISIRASAMRDADGTMIGSWVIIRDISDYKTTLRELQHSQNMLQQTSRMSRVGGWELNTETSLFSLTEETYQILSIPRSYHTSVKNIAKLLDPESEKLIVKSVNAVLRGKGSNTSELKLMGFSPERWIRVSAQLAFEEKGQRYAYGAVQDISDFKQQQKSLESARDTFQQMAFHDPLTNLPNRLLLEDRFQQITNQARRDKKIVALLIVDLDDFKGINDAYGHPAGDKLLIQFAKRLAKSIRSSDTVARLGGDEFVVIAMLEDKKQAASLAKKILAKISRPVAYKDASLQTSCSMGISLSYDLNSNFEQLYAQADTALYYIKDHGKDAFGFAGESEQA